MLFTTKTEYGLKALVILAKNKTKEPLSLGEISRQTEISLGYLEQIFSKLKAGGLVLSLKGSGGGYVLARPARCIKLLEVIEALEGDLAIFYCMSQEGCSSKYCLTKKVWVDLQNNIVKTLNKYKLSDLI
jgi:Rrf2 family iron-sulfur cluster assembly transcriptional regulator